MNSLYALIALFLVYAYSESYVKDCIGSDLKLCKMDFVDANGYRDVKCYLEINEQQELLHCSNYDIVKKMMNKRRVK